MPTVYVHAASKKEVIEKIAKGLDILTMEYTPSNTFRGVLRNYRTGTVVKIWDKLDGARNPVAKSYGNWNQEKNKLS